VWHSWNGAGIKVAVFDQGIDSTHPDLNDNILIGEGRRASNLSVGGDPIRSSDNHGTAVAGVIGAEANGVGVIGVAPKVSLVSIYSTLSASPAAFSAEVVNAFRYAQSFDVLNNSWGFGNSSVLGTDYPWAFMDNFRTALFFSTGQALKDLAEMGRNGLGTVVVQSAGNSYSLGDDTNLHNFQNSRYIITVAGTDYQGAATSYSAPGASVLIAAPGGQQNANNNALSEILTTDRVGALGYSTSDQTLVSGTSFSGPIVSGVVALMLDANPALGYRDVQQILAYSGRKIAVSENQWEYNGASNWNGGGLHFDSLSHNLGFGLIDALAAVRLAESWSSIPLTSANDLEHSITQSLQQVIPDGSSLLSQSINVNQAMEVERVEVIIDISHTHIGDLSILLTSPVGTTSFLLWRPGATNNSPFGQSQNNINFTFNTVLSWGENSVGTWRLTIFDQAFGDVGTLNSWTLNLIGKPVSDDDVYVYTNEFSKSVADQAFRSTLIDSVGIDSINASAVTTNSLINLQSGSQSNIDGRALTISPDSIIENVVSGDGNDTIYGNKFNNFLRGMRGNDSLFGFDGDDSLEGGWGNDTIDGGTGTDTVIWGSSSINYQLRPTVTGWQVADKTATDGMDTLISVEKLQFSDRVVLVESKSHASYANLPAELYQFFITAFNAAPGVTYMDQLAEAYNYGLSVKEIVDIFTTKSQFTSVYAPTLSNQDLATQLVNNIIKTSATADAKTSAINDIKEALDIGWTVGRVIFQVFGNLAKIPLTDPSYGNTTKQFNNQIAVAKYYTDTLNQSTTDLETLRDVVQSVTSSTNVSSDEAIAQLIGVALLTGGDSQILA
jgi:subtilisin-like proprotein convertase family protein